MPDGNETTPTASDVLSQGTEANEGDGEETEEDENTAENVAENNPEDNKKLSEITMAEELRKTFNLKLMIPRILQGLHTNQFFFIDVTDEFYEENYPEIITSIAYKKFARMAGFQKGRFFVEKVEEQGGIDGWKTTITLNPIPPSLANYSKMQKEAQKALIHAINWEISLTSGGGTGVSNSGGNVNSTELIGIGNELAAKYTFCGRAGSESYTAMKSKGCGSCWAWSGALYTELSAKGFQVKVIEYATSYSSRHRSVQVNLNGTWEDYPYRETNIPNMAYSTSSKPGLHDVTGETLQNIL